MWGTHDEQGVTLPWVRIIPTYVGNTVRIIKWPVETPDHPHVCGEHKHLAPRMKRNSGSSPRMWGTRPLAVTESPLQRIIPTYVGNTM